jgi:hypothetical protein
MSAGPWNSYEDNKEEFESMSSRGQVTSELEITDSQLSEVEKALGFSVDEALDEFSLKFFESSRYETDAAVRPDGGKMVLESIRDISPGVLAHESVHGRMMQPDASNYLPGDNQFEQTIYDEFVARMAEDEIKPLNVTDKALGELKDAHEQYIDTREKYVGEIFSEEFDSLYQDVLDLERTDDQDIHEEMDRMWRPYQKLREQVLAAEAAKRYKEENEVVIEEFVKPDENLYQETMAYIQQVEQDVI